MEPFLSGDSMKRCVTAIINRIGWLCALNKKKRFQICLSEDTYDLCCKHIHCSKLSHLLDEQISNLSITKRPVKPCLDVFLLWGLENLDANFMCSIYEQVFWLLPLSFLARVT